MSLARPTYIPTPKPDKANHPNRSVTREAHEGRQQQQQRDYSEMLAMHGLSAEKIGALRNPNAPRGIGLFS